LGHELCAEVVEIGPGSEGYSLGDVVTVAPVIPCMRCAACSRGQENLCESAQVIGCNIHGGLAEQIVMPAGMVLAGGVVQVPDGIEPRAACLAEVVGCCLHGLRQTGVSAGDRILIVGDGPIGLTFLQLCKLMGARHVVTSGRRPSRRDLAAALGADETLDARRVDLANSFGRAFDLVVVAASSIEATAEAPELVRSGGRLLLFSGYTYGAQIPLDVNAVHYRELHIHGSIDCTIRDFREAVALLPQLQMERLITASFPLDRAEDGFRSTRTIDSVKTIIEP
jgi:L-iditol 2-dehydrogenase